ncbi:hypothetical protein ACNKU7_18510 [Microbulbifer sp. SA54]|uniref:hypothetical protein n=1 Tax=Microbulbifer sp. SA54 TaxID=3401577 RepID=UPI003AAD2305
MKKISAVLLVGLLSGCTSATLVKAPGVSSIPSEYAPVNAGSDNFGTVKYLDEGAAAVRDARKKDAYKKMYEACNGKYAILDAGSSESNPTFSTHGNLTFAATSSTVFINFKCVE